MHEVIEQTDQAIKCAIWFGFYDSFSRYKMEMKAYNKKLVSYWLWVIDCVLNCLISEKKYVQFIEKNRTRGGNQVEGEEKAIETCKRCQYIGIGHWR